MFAVIQHHDVLTEEQCTYLIEHHRDRLQPSEILGRVSTQIRTSFSYKLPALREDIADVLHTLVADATGASPARLERWELLHYLPGGYFRAHADWMHPKAHKAQFACGGQRTHSVIVYLSNVRAGGETVFSAIGKTISPKRGLFVAWNNTYAGKPLHEAVHEAKPVLAGEKWVLVTWIREHAYQAPA